MDLLKDSSLFKILRGQDKDTFVPGRQTIIRRKTKTEEPKPVPQTDNMSPSKMNDSMMRSSGSLNDYQLVIPHDPLFQFEKEDYENTRPLKVDEFIK
jgi:hypothetical protein